MIFWLKPSRHSVVGALSIVGIFVCTACPAFSADKLPSADGRNIEKVEIAPGIYQFMTLRDSYVRQLNSVAIVNENDVLVFDTNTRPSSAQLILDEIRRLTSKPVRYVVNSHWHPDHWSGNEVYLKAFPDLQIIASEQMLGYMLNTANAWPRRFQNNLKQLRNRLEKEVATGKKDDGSPLTAEGRMEDEEDVKNYASLTDEQVRLKHIFPNLTYTGKLAFVHGGREFRFMSVTGDADGTTVLYLPREKVLITGDVISYPIPYFTPPPGRHAASLRELAQLDTGVIVPGHGPAFRNKDFLHLELQLLETVIAGVRGELRKGALALADIQAVVTAESLREKFTHNDPDLDARFRERVKFLVKIAIREEVDNKDY
ncbi:MAG TPA: MBL fold metallo-hydrolase [Bryobacteraceae bacterium]|nr:MBL fold metallo-hydrolase [Bryobacteraceae bacterium]